MNRLVMRLVVEPIGAAIVVFFFLRYGPIDVEKLVPSQVENFVVKPVLEACVAVMIGLLVPGFIAIATTKSGAATLVVLAVLGWIVREAGFPAPTTTGGYLYAMFGVFLLVLYVGMLVMTMINHDRRPRYVIGDAYYGIWYEERPPEEPVTERLPRGHVVGWGMTAGALAVYVFIWASAGLRETQAAGSVFAGLAVFVVAFETGLLVGYRHLASDLYYWLNRPNDPEA